MSLEETLSKLVDAVTGVTDALVLHAAELRQARTAPQLQQIGVNTSSPAPRPGRPPKSTPPAPIEGAAVPNVQASPGSTTAPPAASTTPSAQTATQAGAASSAASSGEPAATYADLAALVPEFVEKHGRTKAIAIFNEHGAASGKELNEKFPEKVPAVVAAFRAAVAEGDGALV